MNLIKLKEVTKYYHSENSVTLALKDINLELKKGEFVAITGKSGSGKSTLINVISGMDTYEEGEMYFRGMETSFYGNDDWELFRKNNISFVYQSYNLIESYTALQNVESVIMICENDDNRLTKKQRKEKAMEALKKVGLGKQANNKASHMSSGQKQRLGIARALAKDTDIIIADEPTGNLDVENGNAIMAILHELSKEKLVLVVTHNYEQAEPYATRKIRLFDGEIVEDLKISKEIYEDNDFQSDFTNEIVEEKEAEKTFKVARRFVKMNRWAQPHRSLFIFFFLVLSSLSSTIFLGYFLSNIDDTKTRYTSTKAFPNISDDRLIVKRLDGENITDDDIDEIQKMSYIEQVEKYEHTNDCNYFSIENEDYKKEYKVGIKSKLININLLDYTHFIKSSSKLTNDDLSAGRLPEAIDEVVVYSDDESLINEKMEIYTHNSAWKAKYYAGEEFTVVGILKEEQDQIYFSEKFAQIYDYNISSFVIQCDYILKDLIEYNDGSEDTVLLKDREVKGNIVINKELTGNQVRLNTGVIDNLNVEGTEVGDTKKYTTLIKEGKITYNNDDSEVVYDVEYLMDGSLNSANILQVSEELYYKIMGNSNLTQISVFIDDYAYTDDVINNLSSKGYEVISVLKVSSVEYNEELVAKRLVSLLVSFVVLIVVFVLSILVIYLLMRLKKADFIILKSLGMKRKMANQMNFYELLTLTLVSNVAAIIVCYICSYFDLKLISDIMKYYRLKHYIVLFLIGLMMAFITSTFFNRYLGKCFRLTSLKNN